MVDNQPPREWYVTYLNQGRPERTIPLSREHADLAVAELKRQEATSVRIHQQ